MASQEEQRTVKGFGNAPRPQQPQQRPQGGGGVPLGDVGGTYDSAPTLGQQSASSVLDGIHLAGLGGATKALQHKAAEVYGAQALIEGAQQYRANGQLPEDPVLASFVQQYAQLEAVEQQLLGSDRGFFTQKGDTLTINALPQLGPNMFSQAVSALGNPQNRHLLPQSTTQQQLPKGS